MTRTRMALILSAAGVAGVLGLAGCSAQHTAAAAAGAVTSDVADEAQALQTVGFETGLTSTPSASPSTSASAGTADKKKGKRRKAIRSYLRGNTLHGEVTVQGKDGVKTIVVQRGAVTAVTGTSVTVKSTDGFTETWTIGGSLKVVQAKKVVQASALKAGETIGVAGTKTGTADTAGLIAIK